MSGDLRDLLDPLTAVAAARPQYRAAATTYTPDPTELDPDPAPVTIPGRTEVYTPAADLPDVIAPADAIDLSAHMALIHAAVAQLWGDLQIRTVAGRTTLTSGIYLAGATFDVSIWWDDLPGRDPTGGTVSIQSYIGWQGRTTAKIKTGTISRAGCTVTVTVLAAITPDASRPITYEVSGLYLSVPAWSGS